MPDFVNKPGQEFNRARFFMEEVSKMIQAQGDGPIAPYTFLDTFFDWITADDRDYGHMVAYQSEDTPYIEDIFYEASHADYRKAVDSYMDHDLEVKNYMTRPETAKAFWNILAQQLMLSYPTDPAKQPLHIESAVASMFNGNNRFNERFMLFYVEKDPESETFFTTDELGDSLIAASLTNF